jgi:flavin-dependent dehydrogenase
MSINRQDYVIIGGGPAGASLAHALSKKGYRVSVVEANHSLALKPCGNGLVRVEDIPISLPHSSLKVRIRRGLLYVDGTLAVEIRGLVDGYIIDKREMLESLILEGGAELYLRSHFNPNTMEVKVSGERIKVNKEKFILAGGHAFYSGEKIFAVETTVRPKNEMEDDTIEIRFDAELIGYYWVFPTPEGSLQVGVGGFSTPEILKERLRRFLKRDERFGGQLEEIRGASLAVGGVDVSPYKGLLRVGESAGFVLPLTGEGIRPSMISGHSLAEALDRGEDPIKKLRSLHIAKAIGVQRRILERVKAMNVNRRRELLMSIPAEVHAEVALGTLRRGRILKALASNPRLLASLLKIIS